MADFIKAALDVLEEVLKDMEKSAKRGSPYISLDGEQAWAVCRVLCLYIARGGILSEIEAQRFNELEERRKAAQVQIQQNAETTLRNAGSPRHPGADV